jgi:hypothetical protein
MAVSATPCHVGYLETAIVIIHAVDAGLRRLGLNVGGPALWPRRGRRRFQWTGIRSCPVALQVGYMVVASRRHCANGLSCESPPFDHAKIARTPDELISRTPQGGKEAPDHHATTALTLGT